MATLTIKKIDTAIRHPLFHQYDGQFEPQPAYLEIDLESGVVEVDYSGEIGSAVPVRVWNEIVRRYSINPDLTADELNWLLDLIEPLAKQVLAGADIRWDGSNYRGYLDSAEADDADAEIERICDQWSTDSGGVWTAADVFQNFSAEETTDITATTTDEELETIIAEEIKSTEEHFDCTVVGMAEYLTQVRDELAAEEQ